MFAVAVCGGVCRAAMNSVHHRMIVTRQTDREWALDLIRYLGFSDYPGAIRTLSSLRLPTTNGHRALVDSAGSNAYRVRSRYFGIRANAVH